MYAPTGDTWVYGIASDPRKLAEFRALLRVRRALHWDSQEPWYRNMSRFLLKVPEHTWGVDIKTTLRDELSWSNAALRSQLHLSTLSFVATVRSWQRQRAYVDWALDALGACYNWFTTRGCLVGIMVCTVVHHHDHCPLACTPALVVAPSFTILSSASPCAARCCAKGTQCSSKCGGATTCRCVSIIAHPHIVLSHAGAGACGCGVDRVARLVKPHIRDATLAAESVQQKR